MASNCRNRFFRVFGVLGLILTTIGLISLVSCQASGKGNSGTNSGSTTSTADSGTPETLASRQEPADTSSTASETNSTAPTPKSAPSDKEATSEPDAPDRGIRTSNSVKANLDVAKGLKDSATTDRTIRPKFEEAVRQVVKLYDSKKLAQEDHLLLCTTLPSLLGAAQSVDKESPGAIAQHCDAYIAGLPDDQLQTVQFRSAVFAGGKSHIKAGNYAAAEVLYRDFLDIFCSVEEDPSNARKTPGCRQVLTQFLPQIYHENGDVGLLLALLDECSLFQIERDSDLRGIRSYLLTDLWKIGRIDAIEDVSKTVLDLNVWGEFSNPSRELIPLALSARSRALLAKGKCYAARQVYLDYDFYNSNIDAPWRNDHISVPSRLLCRPAPSVRTATNWVTAAPVLKKGKSTLLHFMSMDSALSADHLTRASEIAGRIEHADVVSLIPNGSRLYDTVSGKILSGLTPIAFAEKVTAIAESKAQAIGILHGGQSDAMIQSYGIKQFPTLVLIGPDGTVVAYDTSGELDAGWEVLAKSLADK